MAKGMALSPTIRRAVLRLWVPTIKRLRKVRAWSALLVAMRRRSRAAELWIGDSHALSYNQRVHQSNFVKVRGGPIVLRVGPRLMWSLAEKGFPARVHHIARIVSRFGVAGSIVPVFVAGEIDVRCHLAGRPEDFRFVTRYVDRCREVAHTLGAARLVFAVPPPPSADCPNVEEFPIRGTIGERVTAFDSLRRALVDAVAATPGAELLDATDDLRAKDGALRSDLTDDGCHVNLDGVVVVRAVAEHLDLTTRVSLTPRVASPGGS
jgi:hypothetical protein